MNPQMTLRRPETDEYFEYYGLYINKVPEGSIVELLESQISEFRDVFGGIDEQTASILHEPYTWTIKQVMGHLIDVERVFGYRAHRFAAGDLRPILGMEQNPWVDNLDYETPTMSELTSELESLRRANLAFLRRIPASAWDLRAEADGNEMTVRALAYCLVGHVTHHLDIIKQRIA